MINLKPLTRYLREQHFKMDTWAKVINLVQKVDWAICIDLNDAYIYIPKKILRFCFKGVSVQGFVLWPTASPRVWTKITALVAAYLRAKAIRLAVYFDDWLQLNQDRMLLIRERQRTPRLMLNQGLIINVKKSALEPSQILVYHCFMF